MEEDWERIVSQGEDQESCVGHFTCEMPVLLFKQRRVKLACGCLHFQLSGQVRAGHMNLHRNHGLEESGREKRRARAKSWTWSLLQAFQRLGSKGRSRSWRINFRSSNWKSARSGGRKGQRREDGMLGWVPAPEWQNQPLTGHSGVGNLGEGRAPKPY